MGIAARMPRIFLDHVRPVVERPLVTLLLSILLFRVGEVSLATYDPFELNQNWSLVSRSGGLANASQNSCAISTSRYAYAAPGSPLKLLDPDFNSWDEMTQLLERPDVRAYQVRAEHSLVRHGLLAPIFEVESVKFYTLPLKGAALAADERVRLLEAMSGVLRDEWRSRYRFRIDKILGKDQVVRRFLFVPTLLNFLLIVLAVAWLLSLAWIPRGVRWVLSTKRRRRVAAGCCANCGYSLAGLSSSTCPECGAAVIPPEPQRGAGV